MQKYHTLFLSLALSILYTHALFAQIVGGTKSGQSLPTEIKPSSVDAGSFSGNVSLFSGTYNASYPLGTVTTAGGLGFTANLSYSSAFTSGGQRAPCLGSAVWGRLEH